MHIKEVEKYYNDLKQTEKIIIPINDGKYEESQWTNGTNLVAAKLLNNADDSSPVNDFNFNRI